MVPLVFFCAGTASADDGSADAAAPIHPQSSYDVFPNSWMSAGYGGAGVFDPDYGYDEDSVWYSADGAFAGHHGAGTFGVVSGADEDEAWYATEGTYAGHHGVGAFGNAYGVEDNDVWYSDDYDTNHNVMYHDNVYIYDNHPITDETWANGTAEDDLTLVRPHSIKENSSVPDVEHGVTTAPATDTLAQRPVSTPHVVAGVPHPAIEVHGSPINHWSVSHESGLAAGPYGAANYEATTTTNDVECYCDEDTTADEGVVMYHPGFLPHE